MAIFRIEAIDLGEVSKVRIGHDDSGAGSGWFLDNVVVTNEKTGKEWVFNCGRWLDKTEDDKAIVRTLVATSAPPSSVNGM